jgi:ribosomal protein L29
MKFKELKTKSDKELGAMLNKSREDLENLKFKVASRQMKDVREIRVAKKIISRILTLQEERKKQPKVPNN